MATDSEKAHSSGERPRSVFERNRRTTLAVVVLVAFCVADVLLANALALVGLYDPPRVHETHYRIRHPVYHHTLRPNVGGYDARFGPLEHPIRTNSLGFKDGEAREVELSPRAPRVVFVGDSFTEGVGVVYSRTFVGRIAAALARDGVEVLNAGVSSYSPVIYRRKIETLWEEGLRFDHLVVFIDLSDVLNETRHWVMDDDGRVVDRRPPGAAERFREWLTDNSITFAHVRRWIRLSKRGADDEPNGVRKGVVIDREESLWTLDDARYASWGRRGLELAASHMDALHAFSGARGFDLTIAVYPWPDQIWHRDLESRQVVFWRAWAAARDVPFIDFFPTFVRDDLEPQAVIREYFIPGDFHWNEAGHALIAERLLRELSSFTPGAPNEGTPGSAGH